jgi:GH35 family endo-1,4-beta-xylanase
LHFVWGKEKYVPDWVKAIKDPKQLEQVIESHIKTVSEYIGQFTLPRYPYQLDVAGTPLANNPMFQPGATNVPLVQSISVVNEPLSHLYWQGSGQTDYFYEILGEKYIFKSFELARKYAPQGTLLLLNDTNMLGETDRTANKDKMMFETNLKIASRLRQSGLIDGLGFQMHTDAQRVMDVGEVTRRLQIVVNEGLLAIPTELDVHVHNMPGDENLKQQRQADTFEFWVRTFYETAKCRMFSVFSLSDNESWLRDSLGWTDANETLFDKNYKPKPSHDRLVTLLEKLLSEKQKSN